MSAKGGSAGAIALGVVVAIFAIATSQYYLLFTSAMLIAGGAFGLAMGPQALNQDASKARDLEIASSGEGFPVPVIFGEQKVIGNFMYWDKEHFRSEEVHSGGSGDKDSQPDQLVGYAYFLSFEYALCMGPIDAVEQVWSSPGEIPMRGTAPSVLTLSTDYVNITLSGENEGGLCRLYQGNDTQVREPAGDPFYSLGMNYRQIAFAEFIDFNIGRHPQPKSYQFILRRLPKCVRDDLTTVTGIKTNGSSNSAHPSYKQANPAAIIYEIATNKIWGRGLSSTIFNEQSFIDASVYFWNQNIGMSFTFDTPEKFSSIIDQIRQHLKILLLWDGETYKMKTLLDASVAHANIQTLNKSDIANVEFVRPTWNSTTNEIRAEFVNKARNYRSDAVHAPDLANQQITGRKNTKTISLNGFTDWNVTRRQAFRILREMSYPVASLSFTMNRFKSQLEVGDCFRVYWDEYGANPVTIYFTVLRKEEASAESDDIKVTAVEDPSIPALEGTETGDIIHTPGWQIIPDVLEGDIQLWQKPSTNNGEITPIQLLDAPALLTGGVLAFVITLGQKISAALTGYELFWAPAGSTSFIWGGIHPKFASTGALLTNLDTINLIDRSPAGFQFALTNPSVDETIVLAVNRVPTDNAHMETLIGPKKDFIVVGEEIIQVGLIEKLATNTYRARNFIRARFGTRFKAHTAGAAVFYRDGLNDGFPSFYIPQDQIIDWKIYPRSTAGSTPNNTIVRVYHDAPWNGYYRGSGVRPLGPQLVSFSVGGGNVTAIVRPRFYEGASGRVETLGKYNAGTNAVSGLINRAVTSLEGMTFVYFLYSTSGTLLNGQGQTAPMVFTPGSVADNVKASVTLTLPTTYGSGIAVTVKKICLYAQLKGFRSLDCIEINL